ncbi:uncharacterized protein HKW66_Vig0002070 [Vigna angularis]|uniref:Uncharacterized protein n=1 Tax=Phaseolus angularis TaxID=3914 RepID=A0A8T0LD96_PHAAN|nr:uncharacterized protein HKW66_Vig0002070 [Vigna angularis]
MRSIFVFLLRHTHPQPPSSPLREFGVGRRHAVHRNRRLSLRAYEPRKGHWRTLRLGSFITEAVSSTSPNGLHYHGPSLHEHSIKQVLRGGVHRAGGERDEEKGQQREAPVVEKE